MRTSIRERTVPTLIVFNEGINQVDVTTHEPRIIDYFDYLIQRDRDGVLEVLCAADGSMNYRFTKELFIWMLTHGTLEARPRTVVYTPVSVPGANIEDVQEKPSEPVDAAADEEQSEEKMTEEEAITTEAEDNQEV